MEPMSFLAYFTVDTLLDMRRDLLREYGYNDARDAIIGEYLCMLESRIVELTEVE